jgi:hypothetical protein
MNLQQIYFCAKECARQRSGEISVAHMCSALDYASELFLPFNGGDVMALGLIVEPGKVLGFRNVPAFIDGKPALNSSLIEHSLESLLDNREVLTPEEFYQEFEEIHPFVDGNGRVGAILYNLLMGTLEFPITPPEFK